MISIKRKYKKKFKKYVLLLVLVFIILFFINVNLNKRIKIDYHQTQELDLSLYSDAYLIMDLDDYKVLYAHNNDKRIFPASLTKIMTLATTLRLKINFEDYSYFTNEQREKMIAMNSSLAYLETDKEYSIKDLLYALILPSGGDSALAIENYFINHNLDLIKEMNKTANILKLKNSHFVNATGLHDDNHYSSLDDILKILIYTLRYDDGKEILSSLKYILEDELIVYSTLNNLEIDGIRIIGGKTGNTKEAGMCLALIYEYDNSRYLLLSANAKGDDYKNYHFIDAYNIIYHIHLDD